MKQLGALDFLEHIAQSAREAIAFTDNMTREAFVENRQAQQAVVMSLIVMGEAVSKLRGLDPAFLDQYPDMPWNAMRGIRNRMVHGYFDINLDLVWTTARVDLPEVARGIDRIIAALRG